MRLTAFLTALVIALGTVALGYGAAATPPVAAGGPQWLAADAAVARPAVVFAAGVAVLALTTAFLALRIPAVLRRRGDAR